MNYFRAAVAPRRKNTRPIYFESFDGFVRECKARLGIDDPARRQWEFSFHAGDIVTSQLFRACGIETVSDLQFWFDTLFPLSFDDKLKAIHVAHSGLTPDKITGALDQVIVRGEDYKEYGEEYWQQHHLIRTIPEPLRPGIDFFSFTRDLIKAKSVSYLNVGCGCFFAGPNVLVGWRHDLAPIPNGPGSKHYFDVSREWLAPTLKKGKAYADQTGVLDQVPPALAPYISFVNLGFKARHNQTPGV